MTTDEFLELLEGVKPQRGGGWMAKCPAHEDSTQSLAIKEGDEGGRIVLHCFAGCGPAAVVSALGLTMSDLFDGDPEAETVYTYTDEHNTPMYEVVRFPGKQFKQRMPDGTWGIDKDVRKVLYRLPEVLAAQKVIICEGEKDVEAARRLGLVGTCNVGGAGKWRPEYSEFLAGKDVLVVADRDEPGRKHATDVQHALGGVARSVQIRRAKVGKDLSDHLAAGLGINDLVVVRDRRPDGVVTASELADHAIRDTSRVKPDRSAFFMNPWGCPEPEFVPGRLYVLGAVTAGGKTSAALQLFRSLSERGTRVCYVSMEMTEADIRNRLLCHVGASLKALERPWEQTDQWKAEVRAHANDFKQWRSEVVFSTSADAALCNELIAEGDIDFLIFDHLHQVLDVAGGEEKQIATQIRAFRNLALDWEIPVLVLSQFKRPFVAGTAPALSDFKGSSAIEQNAAMALALHCNNGSYELHILKNRDGMKGTYYLRFDGPRFSFHPMVAVAEGDHGWP